MSEYLQVARHLGMVRRAYKRAAALSGLAIVCMESIGLLTLALLLDWIYQPHTAVRVGLFVVVLGMIAVLVVRHVDCADAAENFGRASWRCSWRSTATSLKGR